MEISCLGPEKNLYLFKGDLNVTDLSGKDQKFSIDLLNFIPRGSVLKNSGKVRVLILYSGLQTKMFLNQGKYHFKRSQLDKKINVILFFNIIAMFVLMGIMSGRYYQFLTRRAQEHWYIFPENPLDV
mmetsp:Transcript_7801/g.7257  ORF Transcript_7801/g.7257 Transcript_7801/m.7257 type:complete len:127 (+) Transcript_7801:613-993(+)|eukprot:CAMPEP_0170542390 /NCGR_PEP_ID=MMETSP0211-20121228/1829_1 /TAXON_ID=311385 /ORGANISM="Pseudokeronopsis sp., Strain OXSARD2" /LENGTH=126 /DNA_ID=CAMNT_0010845431 /DNA_START=569 /DNA_END=949 /DNA_ORIENTATION=-